eukprot:gene30389-56230_t
MLMADVHNPHTPCTQHRLPAEKVLLSVRHAVLTYRFEYFVRGADDAVVFLGDRRKSEIGPPLRRVWSGRFLP